ncbi:MAG: aminoglycoside phosphotransferase family protein [Gaiellaceae bacterium]
MRVPDALSIEWRHEPKWLAALPRLVDECADAWGLELEAPISTPHSLVIPAGEVVLKLNAPSHFEADHEADALELWSGQGAVCLVSRDDTRRAFLCERCRPGIPLSDASVDDAAVVAELLPRLAHEPLDPHPFRLLTAEAERWADEVPRRFSLAGEPFERALVGFAVDVFESADPRASHLVNQDLHGGNILRAEREPWLVIDPKPLVGEREIDGVGLLRNAATGADPTISTRRWLDALSDLGLDRARLRGWGVAHALAWGWHDERGWSCDSVKIARTIHSA